MASVDYDVCSDVLYVSLTKPTKVARTVEGNCEALFRFKDGKLVGVTILDFAAQAGKAAVAAIANDPDMIKAQQLCNEHNQSIVQKSIERDGDA